MASLPNSANSPPGPAALALPRQRPTLALPGANGPKSRKPSIASATSSSHPLRQTSFPPAADNQLSRQYSPGSPGTGAGLGDDDDLEFSDSEIVSAISGPTGPGGGNDDGSSTAAGKKRKRGTGKMGRPRKDKGGSASAANGDEGKKAQTAPPDEDEDDEDDAANDADTKQMSSEMAARFDEIEKENGRRHLFYNHINAVDKLPLTDPAKHGVTRSDLVARNDLWHRVKLRNPDVKRLVNQVLGQSVPGPVVLAVMSMMKIFAGGLVEEARGVQREWVGVEERRADDVENVAYKRLKRTYEEDLEGNGREDKEAQTNGHSEEAAKAAPSSSTPNGTTIKSETSPKIVAPSSSSGESGKKKASDDEEVPPPPLHPAGAGGLHSSIDNCDLGPLTPDHLRESLRRYKKARRGGAVGFTGYSLEGSKGTAARMGGKRLFR